MSINRKKLALDIDGTRITDLVKGRKTTGLEQKLYYSMTDSSAIYSRLLS